MTTTNRAGELLPAADTFALRLASREPSAARPFGLLHAVTAQADESFDPGDLHFDDDRQIVVAVNGTEVQPSWKHTSNLTKTNTGVSDSIQEAPDTDISDS
jgi:hypothetical protein